MTTKAERELAHQAGRAVMTEPAERRSVDACPFPEGSDERKAWLEGFAEALDEHPDPAELRKALDEARA